MARRYESDSYTPMYQQQAQGMQDQQAAAYYQQYPSYSQPVSHDSYRAPVHGYYPGYEHPPAHYDAYREYGRDYGYGREHRREWRDRERDQPSKPCNKLVCLRCPDERILREEDFDKYFNNRPGFLNIIHRGRTAFVEFKDEPSATTALRALNGRRLADGIAMLIDYDRYPERFVGRESERFQSTRRGFGKRSRSRSPLRSSNPVRSPSRSPKRDSERPTKRSKSEKDEKKDEKGEEDDRERGRNGPEEVIDMADAKDDKEGDDVGDGYGDEDHMEVSQGKVLTDGIEWLKTVVPYWERSGMIPQPDRESRLEQADNMQLSKASKLLKVSSLPNNITVRELAVLFRFTPNCLRVTLKRSTGVGIVEYPDQLSAHISMIVLNNYEISPSEPITVEYFKA